jgi:uncharacterized membrane protein YqjE
MKDYLANLFFPTEETDHSALFNKWNKRAQFDKAFFQLIWITGIAFGFLAVVIFASTLLFNENFQEKYRGVYLPILEVAFVILSFIFLGLFAEKLKKVFIQSRRNAEYLRIQEINHNCGFGVCEIKSPTQNLQGNEMYPIDKEIINWQSKCEKIEEVSFEGIEAFYKGQIKYHNITRIEKYEKRNHFIHLLLIGIIVVFSGFIILKLVLELYEHKHLHLTSHDHDLLLWSKFFIICLPPLYAAIEAIVYFSEWNYHIKKSEETTIAYAELLKNPFDKIVITQKLNELFNEENINWLMWYHNKRIGPRL